MAEEKVTLSEVVEKFDFNIECGEKLLERKIEGGYVSDLLSDVMANCKENYLWITLQGHQNIVAVASLKEIAGIIIINGRKPDEETLKKARNENVFIATSDMAAFELVGRLYNMGIPGSL